jgi:S-adenosylmethionine:tRNA ribosyltransferase-isomerase
MKVSDFDFELPDSRIAQHPAEPRDSARLLHVAEALNDWHIPDLPRLLNPGDLMVFNNTKVIPSRLSGIRRRTDGEARIEVTLHKAESETTWWAFARPAKRLKPGDVIAFADGFAAAVEDRKDGEVLLSFDTDAAGFRQGLLAHGLMPLPPYIKRSASGDRTDHQNYQTLFAAKEGAVAAPTAGLHFTDGVMAALETAGVRAAFVTLHVGAGTFLPVKVEDTDDHVMHAEWGELDQATADLVNETHRNGRHVIATGSTSLRLLETAASDDAQVRPFTGETDIFITPGYRFNAVDRMFTNFHLPKSTLFMLVAAFAGLYRMRGAYAHAIDQGYRFFSYGDACLLDKADGA